MIDRVDRARENLSRLTFEKEKARVELRAALKEWAMGETDVTIDSLVEVTDPHYYSGRTLIGTYHRVTGIFAQLGWKGERVAMLILLNIKKDGKQGKTRREIPAKCVSILTVTGES